MCFRGVVGHDYEAFESVTATARAAGSVDRENERAK